MYFDRFDICEAWYLWLSENHEGQWSDKYRRLCQLLSSFTPRPGLCDDGDLTENGQDIYRGLNDGE